MRAVMFGYTLIEVLIVVAMVSVLVGLTITYTVKEANLRLAELEFREHYQKAESILIHGQTLHTQGFRSTTALNITQLSAATQGSNGEAIADQIAKITADYTGDDFKIRFADKYIQVKFLVADEVVLNGYPVSKQSMVGSKDEVLLRKTMRTERSRALKSYNYLTH